MSTSRSRRSKPDKNGKFALLEQLKEAKNKGEKLKRNLVDEDDVYENVDEHTYSEIVQRRQEDDWIVDDDGLGYVDDGREIFDEEMESGNSIGKGDRLKKSSRNANVRSSSSTGESGHRDIKAMFMAAGATLGSGMAGFSKRKSQTVALEDGELDDLLAELDSGPIIPKSQSLYLKKKRHSDTDVNREGAQLFHSHSPKVQDPFARSMPCSSTPARSSSNPTRHPTPVVSSASLFCGRLQLDNTIDDSQSTATILVEETVLEDSASDLKSSSGAIMDVSDINFDEPMDRCDQLTAAATASAERINSDWLQVNDKDIKTSSSSSSSMIDGQLPLVPRANGERVFRFFWLDAYEDVQQQPGVLFLFGKTHLPDTTGGFASCCVRVSAMERRLFLLPRPEMVDVETGKSTGHPVTMQDVYNEFLKFTNKNNIQQFKCRTVKKKYAFELQDVPADAEYMEVRYSADRPAWPSDAAGRSFSHVFGATASGLEIFLLDKRLRGPCWLEVEQPRRVDAQFSWCRIDVDAANPQLISIAKTEDMSASVTSPPALSILSLSLQYLTNSDGVSELVCVGSVHHTELHLDRPPPDARRRVQGAMGLVTHSRDTVLPFDLRQVLSKRTRTVVSAEVNERALLGRLLVYIHRLDPDVIVGHDLPLQFGTLLHRLHMYAIPGWHRLGRLRRAGQPARGQGLWPVRQAFCGRLLVDTLKSAKELIKGRSYDLSELCNVLLQGKQRLELPHEPAKLRAMFGNSDTLYPLIEASMNDAESILHILHNLQVLPLALQITRIVGNVLARTLLYGRNERNEFLLLHAFEERDYVCPDSHPIFSNKGKRGRQHGNVHVDLHIDDEDGLAKVSGTAKSRQIPGYTGGLVLEPKRGFHDKMILLLDFNSLYPSIIQEFNICFTTVNRSSSTCADAAEENGFALPDLPDQNLEPGVLPAEIRKLVESRRVVKQMLKAPDLKLDEQNQLDIRQKALKLTANSMYGCLGYPASRFFAKPLAALVTHKGREILMRTKDLVEGMNLEVIYGDTDSIMINSNLTDYDQCLKLGAKVKNEVNKHYRLLELDLDGIYYPMLLCRKKKYAALAVLGKDATTGILRTQREVKGLEIVRRDWSRLATGTASQVVDLILASQQRELLVEQIHSLLNRVATDLRNNVVPMDQLCVAKTLAKNPEDYSSNCSDEHVAVALRDNAAAGQSGQRWRRGDTVEYIICDDGSEAASTKRAYSVEQMNRLGMLKVDVMHYLSKEVLPLVTRLTEHIEGTDPAHQAECLGLDSSQYVGQSRRVGVAFSGLEAADEEEAELAALLGVVAEERFAECEPLRLPCPGCTREVEVRQTAWPLGQEEPTLAECPHCHRQLLSSKQADLGHVERYLTNQLQLLLRHHTRQYYLGWLRCEDAACGMRTRRCPMRTIRGQPLCPQCSHSALRPECNEAQLYNQLAYYAHLLQLERSPGAAAALASKQPIFRDINKAHLRLSEHVKEYMKVSAFSVVDLGQLFCTSFGVSKMTVKRNEM